jgi:integrase
MLSKSGTEWRIRVRNSEKMFSPTTQPTEVARTLTAYSDWRAMQHGKKGGPVSDETVRKQSGVFRGLLNGLGPVETWTTRRVFDYVQSSTMGKSPQTFNQVIDALNSVRKFVKVELKQSVEWHDVDVFGRKPVSSRSRHVLPPIARDELEAVVAAARKRGDETMALYLEVAWDTFGRASELCALKVRDFDFDNPEYGDAQVTFSETKTGYEQPGFIWTPGLAERLRDWFENRRVKTEWAFPGTKSTNPDAAEFYTGHVNYDSARNRFRTYMAAAGVKRHTLHNIRAGALVWAQAHGWTESTIMFFGRWESLSAMSRYSRAVKTVVEADVNRARAAMAPAVRVKNTPRAALTPELLAAIARLAPEAQVAAIARITATD